VSAATASSPVGDSPSPPNNRVVTAFFSALTEGRYDDAAGLVAPNATWWVLGKRDYVDPGDWLAALSELFPNGLGFTLDRVTEGATRIAVQASGRATLADGRAFDNAYHFAFEIGGGRILGGWEYGDTRYVAQLLGS
jgi:ketosteroid isomerase-like protein